MKTRVGLIPNPYCEIRKPKIRTRQVLNKKSIGFDYKNKTKTKQGCDKKRTKIGVEHAKCIGEFYLYLYPLGA
jgi:hypothetical protein